MNIAALAPRLKGLVKIGKAYMAANRPEILFGTSVVSTVAAVGLSAKAGWDSRGDVERERADRVLNSQDEWFESYLDFSEAMDNAPQLTRKEIVDMTWKNYVPTAVAAVSSLGSTTGLHIVHIKEKKQIAGVAMAAIEEVKSQANEYAKDISESIREVAPLTEEEEQKVNDRLLEKNSDRHGGVAWVSNSDGEVEELYLVRDAKTGRDIWSNETRIERAINEVNSALSTQGDCELNLFYSLAGYGLIPDGDDWGWSGDTVNLKWDTTVRDDGRPVRRFSFRAEPKEGFNSAHG